MQDQEYDNYDITTLNRIASFVIGTPFGCWEWQRHREKFGYGMVAYRGKHRLAHRVAYQLIEGPIPDGMELDHLCRNPPCVNPEHLEPVTPQENMRRRWNITRHAPALTTHCGKGHEYTPENTYWVPATARYPKGRRECRTCVRLRAVKHYRVSRKQGS